MSGILFPCRFTVPIENFVLRYSLHLLLVPFYLFDTLFSVSPRTKLVPQVFNKMGQFTSFYHLLDQLLYMEALISVVALVQMVVTVLDMENFGDRRVQGSECRRISISSLLGSLV